MNPRASHYSRLQRHSHSGHTELEGNGSIEVHRSLLNPVLYEKRQLERDEKPTEQSG